MNTSAMHRVVILTLLAGACLLVVPGAAGAKVNARYRAEYKSTLKMLTTYFNGHAVAYDNNQRTVLGATEGMKDVLDDPDQLLVARQGAAKIFETSKDGPPQLNRAFAKQVDKFSARASRYFSATALRSRFKDECRSLKAGARWLIEFANVHGYWCWWYLSQDPPDFTGSSSSMADGDADAAKGHEDFEASMAKLKAML